MGFLRAVIDYEDNKYKATLYFSWLYLSEQTIINTFDSLEDAKEWILQERCYNQLQITDEAHSALSYKDALKLQLHKNKNSRNKNKNKKIY